MPFYKVRNTGKLLDGQIIETGEVEVLENWGRIVEVTKVIDPNTMLGDKDFSLPVANGTVWVNASHLEEYDYDPNREYSSKNHLGAHRLSGEMTSGAVKVVYGVYEQGLSIAVLELPANPGGTARTVYSQYYYKEVEEFRRELEKVLQSDDLDDLIFFLKKRKEEELNGQEG